MPTRRPNAVSLLVKVLFTVFMAAWVPTSWHTYGPTNFLYFCNVVLFFTLVGLWTGNSLLISMSAVGVVIPQGLWIADFCSHLLGSPWVGTTNYMFEASNPPLNRFLALFHIWLPILLVWLVFRLGYDSRAPLTWMVTAAVLTLICYLWTPAAAVDPEDRNTPYNINFVFGLRGKQERMPELAWLAFVMVVPQLVAVVPMHALFLRFARPVAIRPGTWRTHPRSARPTAPSEPPERSATETTAGRTRATEFCSTGGRHAESRSSDPPFAPVPDPPAMLERHQRPTRNKGVYTGFERRDLPLLITYSRSGTNCLRYVIELLSGRPTPGHRRLHGGDDFVIDRAQEGYRVASEYERIILVVRNHKECLVRHAIDDWKANKAGSHRLDVTEFLDDRSGRQPPAWFIENIRAFDEFPGDKLLLHYEDLMTEPEPELRRLIEFLDLPRAGVDDLFANLDEHRRRSVDLYRQNQASYTEGDADKLSHHSDALLSDAEKRAFDAYYADRHPELFKRYLSRYASPE